MGRSHLWWAIALSIALHAGLLALLLRAHVPAIPGREPLKFEILYAEPAPSPAPRSDAVPSSKAAVAAGKAAGAGTAPEKARPATPPAPKEGEALGEPAPSPSGGESFGLPADRGAALGDLPRVMPAGPSSALGERMVEEGSRGSRTYGSLARNEPELGPGRQALLDAERAAVKGRVDRWTADGAAEARVNGGIVDGYFSEMRRRLEARLDRPQGVLSGSFVKDFAAAYGHAAQQYAATGNPYRAGEVIGSAPEIDGDTPLARMAQRFPEATSKGRSAVDQAAQRSAQGRMLRDFADGKYGKGLLAIVELRQGGDGRLLSAKLLEPSGSVEFDAHVMSVAPQALTILGPPPATVRIAESGLRSHWAFEGHIVYKRNLREATLLRDGWYLALAGMAGLMTGDFDAGGDATFVDLRHPELKVKVKLLRLYQ